VTDEAPILNWIYIDKETHEAKYGIRAAAQPNLTGPFSCTRQDRRMTFDDWEGFLAVEEEPFLWAVYFDINDDGLKGKLRSGVRVLEIELTRREKRWKKDLPARQEDQNTTHVADENRTMEQTERPTTEESPQPGNPSSAAVSDPEDSASQSQFRSGLPTKGLDLRNADLTLGRSNRNHTPQSKLLSQSLARSSANMDGDQSKRKDDDDTTSITTDMNPSIVSEAIKEHDSNYTPGTSVLGADEDVQLPYREAPK
jgi:hypothetical protein